MFRCKSRVLRTKVQVGVIFDEKYFYRLLLAINSNVDFIVNSIDFQYNMDNKTFMQSSEIYIFIGAYQQLIETYIMQSLVVNIL